MIPIATLRAAGLSDAEIVRVIEADQATEAEKTAKVREQTRERVRRFREKNKQNQSSCNAGNGRNALHPSPSLKENTPLHPLKENNPSLPQDPPSLASLARPPAGAAQKRGCRLASTWKPSAADIEFARRHIGQQWHIEADKFRDYWHARAGPNGVKLDWPATWRNWVRKAAENGHRNGHQKPPGLVAAADELLAEIRAAREPATGGFDDGGQASLFAIQGGRHG